MEESPRASQQQTMNESKPAGDTSNLPTGTYRLQLVPGKFGFRDAAGLIDYLSQLGTSHVYLSPIWKASPGSAHCYDLVDHNELNPELGGEEGYEILLAALERAGMRQLLDFVPNHMSVATDQNAWWNDVLENGPASRHASDFDIDWNPVRDELKGRLLLPILGAQYGAVLETNEIGLVFDGGGLFLTHAGRRLPLDPKTYPMVLDRLLNQLDEADPNRVELESVLTSVRHLPDRDETDLERRAERHREKEVIKRRLADLFAAKSALAALLQSAIDSFRGTPGQPSTFDDLDCLISVQAYRLSGWRVAADDVNYRRFFDVNELAAIAMERAEVFDAAHGLLGRLLARGVVGGLRIDHVDGLFDPGAYLERLQNLARQSQPALSAAAQPPGPLYIVVEKILAHGESLPRHWPIAGTTGYEFAEATNGLFVDAAGVRKFERHYRRLTQRDEPWSEIVYRSKRLILKTSLASDLALLAQRLRRLAERHRHSRDFTFDAIRYALLEILACFSVYRTYLCGQDRPVQDRHLVARAAAEAKRKNPALESSVFDFVRDVLLGDWSFGATMETGQLEFVGRFQQLSSPVMAKGVEDTALYRFVPLASVNDVGSGPDRPSTDPLEFHRQSMERARDWPHSLLAGTTHDSKRSLDVRGRLDVLSEFPGKWKDALGRWTRQNKSLRSNIDAEPAPSRADEVLFYQTLIGTWPSSGEHPGGDYLERILLYMEKATREAKERTSWLRPNERYDGAMRTFITSTLDPARQSGFLAELRDLVAWIAPAGYWTALAQIVLRMTSPGIPDLYQGDELWNFRLVDPDNRQQVDFERRRSLLKSLDEAKRTRDREELAHDLAKDPGDDRTKLFVTSELLRLRGEARDLFERGDYRPLEVTGSLRQQLVAFERTAASEGSSLIVCVPRLWGTLLERASNSSGLHLEWDDTAIELSDRPACRFQHAFTGEQFELAGGAVPADTLLASFPLAVLVSV